MEQSSHRAAAVSRADFRADFRADRHASPRRPRVAIFSDALPERNGAGAYYHDLAAQLGDEVEALEFFEPALKRRFLRLSVPLPGDPTQRLITPDVPRLWRQYRHLRPDLVISVTPAPFGLLGLAFARRSGAGFIAGFHTEFEKITRLYGRPIFHRVANAYLVTANRILCSQSDAVVVNNSGLTPAVRRLGARRVELVGTPLARSFLHEPVVAPPSGLQRVLFAGRLAPEKNLPVIMSAARELPQIEFVIAGEGPLRRRLEREARSLPNVRLPGWLDRPALCREMDAANLLLLPSHLETFGTVALEALARGRPALVAEGAGIHRWPALSDALFRLREGESLTHALRQLQALPAGEWAQRAAHARLAAETLNRQTVAEWGRHLQHYARLDDA